MAKAKKTFGASSKEERVSQLGAAAELLWFFVASVGMHIKGDECDVECCAEGAAKIREQVEKYAEACDCFGF